MNKALAEALRVIGSAYNIEDVNGFTFATDKQTAKLLAENPALVEINPEVKDGDKTATRLTEAGKAAYLELTANDGAGTNGDTTVVENTGNTVAASAAEFVIEDVPVAERSPRGRGPGGNRYPFDKLGVGQSFFVAATPDKPKPATSLSSSVTSANKRELKLAEANGGTAKRYRVESVEGGARVGRVA